MAPRSPSARDPQSAAAAESIQSVHHDSAQLAVGEAFGTRYLIIKLLGMGGMGAVYQAWDQELGVAVALKVIRPEATPDPKAAAEMERRFKRELLLARQVTHTNVVRIHDLGEWNSIKYISMPYVAGEDLSTRLKREDKLPVKAALDIARQMAAGLEAAHQAGVVHRDLKPANIMISAADGHVLIMDFGIARSGASGATPEGEATAPPAVAAALGAASGATTLDITLAPSSPGETMAGLDAETMAPAASAGQRMRVPDMAALASMTRGAIVGTVAYMAPEQARAAPVDHRADIYAFGMMLSEMLVGRRPTRAGESAVDALQRRIQEPPASLRDTDPAIAEAVDAVVMRCLQIDAGQRFQSTGELVSALDRLDNEGNLIPEPVIKRFTPRIMAAAVVLAAAMVTGTWWISRGPAVEPEHPPLSVLIGDFENATGDATLQTTVEQSMGIALEGASFITTFDRQTAKRLAASLGSARGVDEATARLIALREGVNVVLLGRVEPRGNGYRISVRTVDPQGKEIGTVSANAPGKGDVLKAVSQVASEIRDQFGDTTSETAREAEAETFTAASLDAVGEYAQGQDLASAGRDEEAIAHYRNALAKDARFGRAYTGLAVSAYKLGQSDEAADAYNKAFAVLDRMTEREKLRTLGGYYLQFTGSYDKAIDNYGELVRRYPADRGGHSNLALAYFSTLNFAKAMEEGRQAIQIYPRNLTFRSNYALFAMYAGDFKTAVDQARQVITGDSKFQKGYLPLAMAALDEGDVEAARTAYAAMAQAGAAGASLAASGLGDLDLLAGRNADAGKTLQAALAADEKARRTEGLIAKQMALAEAQLGDGRAAQARKTARAGLALGTRLTARVPAARILLRAGDEAAALKIADELGGELQPQNRAYSKIIEAEVWLNRRRPADAVDALIAARKFIDLWLGRFDLGVAYVEGKAFSEAVSELEAADKRRGEASALFLDDWPTVHHAATLQYWLGRAHEGLGDVSTARKNYEAFLKRRVPAADPLVVDARKRLAAL